MASIYHAMLSQGQFVPQTQNSDKPDPQNEKKKRIRNPDQWKKMKRKRAILSGQSYVNTKGNVVASKNIGPDCMCKNKCYLAVTEDKRNHIFNGFYSLESYDKQNAYLYGLIRRYDIQRKRKPASERRTCSYKYFVRVKGREIQVCKKAFANIHGISDKKIRTLCIKHEQNILFPRDNRGRHNNRPKKVTPELVALVKQHIVKMLSGPSGAGFIKTEKNQGPDVNISKLHKNFLQQYEPHAIDQETDKVIKDYDAKVKSWLYFKVFHDEFKSMDFNTVKRKLSDLRKSLEASGTIFPTKKKVNKQVKPKQKKDQPAGQVKQNVPNNVPATITHPPATIASNSQTTYMAPQQTHIPQHLHLSMLGLQTLNGGHPPMTTFHPGVQQPHHHQQQQQPLNLQTSNVQTNDPNTQHIPINLHSVGGHMSSYYLSLSHMSNLISIPVSNNGQAQPAVNSVAVAQPCNFNPQHNMQQFPPGAIFQGQPPANIQSQPLMQGVTYTNQGQPVARYNMYTN